MAITRITLGDIETDILRVMGYKDSAKAPWKTSGELYKIVNRYIQNLPIRCAEVAQLPPESGSIRFDMYKTTLTSTTSGSGLVATAGSSSVTMPDNFDRAISWYDTAEKREFYEIEGADKWLVSQLVTKAAGPIEAIELLDFVDGRRRGTLYPATVSGATPSIRLTYYRLPAAMPGTNPSTEYPDIDPKYQELAICGPVVELSRSTGFENDRYAQNETRLLLDLASTARG